MFSPPDTTTTPTGPTQLSSLSEHIDEEIQIDRPPVPEQRQATTEEVGTEKRAKPVATSSSKHSFTDKATGLSSSTSSSEQSTESTSTSSSPSKKPVSTAPTPSESDKTELPLIARLQLATIAPTPEPELITALDFALSFDAQPIRAVPPASSAMETQSAAFANMMNDMAQLSQTVNNQVTRTDTKLTAIRIDMHTSLSAMEMNMNTNLSTMQTNMDTNLTAVREDISSLFTAVKKSEVERKEFLEALANDKKKKEKRRNRERQWKGRKEKKRRK